MVSLILTLKAPTTSSAERRFSAATIIALSVALSACEGDKSGASGIDGCADSSLGGTDAGAGGDDLGSGGGRNDAGGTSTSGGAGGGKADDCNEGSFAAEAGGPPLPAVLPHGPRKSILQVERGLLVTDSGALPQ